MEGNISRAADEPSAALPPALESRLCIRHSGGIVAGLGQATDLMSTTNRDVGGEGCNGSYAATHSSRHVDGKDVPPEFLELPTGRYVVEPVEEAPC